MLGYFKKLVGDKQEKKLHTYYKKVKEINSLESKIEKYSDDELKAKTTYFKEQLANGQSIDDIQVEAFAVVREAAKRVVGMRHFDVQLIGGMVLPREILRKCQQVKGKHSSLPFQVIYVPLKEKAFMSSQLMIILHVVTVS